MENDIVQPNTIHARGPVLYLDLEGPAKMRESKRDIRVEDVAVICISAEHVDKGAEFASIKIGMGGVTVCVESKAPHLIDVVKALIPSMSRDQVNNRLCQAVLHLLAEKPAHFHQFMQVFGGIYYKNGIASAQYDMRAALGID